MGTFNNLVGRRFGRLVVVSRGANAPRGRTRWTCDCDCGATALVHAVSLINGHTQSCGCLQRQRTSDAAKTSSRTHGKTGVPEHVTWTAALSRCRNPNATSYKRYGGRGIAMCERWASSFEEFLNDMGTKPTPLHTLDRIDKNGNYEPGNCRWATKIEQANNRRDNRMVMIEGVEKTLPNACREAGDVISHCQAWRRIRGGWSHDKAVSTPPLSGRDQAALRSSLRRIASASAPPRSSPSAMMLPVARSTTRQPPARPPDFTM